MEKQIRLLDSNKKLGLVYSDSYMIDAKGNLKNVIVCGRFFKGNIFNKLFEHNFIPLLTVVVRKTALDRVGIFNPKFRTSEEYDLWLRIAEHYSVDFIKQPLAKYRVHDESFSRHIKLTADENSQIIEYWLNRKFDILSVKKRYARLYFRAGWAFYKQEQFNQSVIWYLKAIKTYPGYYKK